MNYKCNPKGVCSTEFNFKINNNIIEDMSIKNGCPGNLIGISKLCIGKDVDEIISKLKGIKCGAKNTSCPDQIALALLEYKKSIN